MTYVIRLQSLKLEQTNFKKKDNYYRKLYINWANKCEGICTHI